MCRMVAKFGDVPHDEAVRGFVRMAEGLNELNERNTSYGSHVHASGWGAVYRNSGGLGHYRNPLPCWEDEYLSALEPESVCLLHARRAGKGAPKEDNTHPFHARYRGKEWFFCHNGSVRDMAGRYRHKVTGDTNSEKLFRFFLESFDDKRGIASIDRAVRSLEDYESLNSFLFDGRHLYAVNAYKKHPGYYTLSVHDRGGGIAISSEPLAGLGGEWKRLENGQIAKVTVEPETLKPLRVELS